MASLGDSMSNERPGFLDRAAEHGGKQLICTRNPWGKGGALHVTLKVD